MCRRDSTELYKLINLSPEDNNMITFYIALAPEGRLDLESYPAVTGWVSRIQALPGYVGMPVCGKAHKPLSLTPL